MKKSGIVAAVLLGGLSAGTAQAGFVVGGENGWQFTTDGFINVFGTYEMIEKKPDGVTGGNLNGDLPTGQSSQQFRVRTGLLPVGIGFNIKSPTIKEVDYAVRLGLYPQVQNNGGSRTDLAPNIDFREIYFTADGKFGQFLAGRAINLYQSKNILTDMCLFGVGVVGPVPSGPTMGHIGYGYLYPNFGAQFRYTTPDMDGVKVAFSVNDTNDIGAATKRNIPRLEAEVSYATTFEGGKMQAWLEGLYQTAGFSSSPTVVPARVNPDGTTTPQTTVPAIRSGGHATSVGGAIGGQVFLGGLELLASGYGGRALGMLGMQGADATDAAGKERYNWGFLAQTTYQLNPEWKIGVNYGQSRAEETDQDKADALSHIKMQQAAVGMVTYSINKNWQVMAEYTWAQDKWFNGATQDGNMIAVGTFFYW
uniref:Outer membrane channel n=1 Tax=Geobacter metallireducens TaxID=28232 RepID=A0A831UJ61_GEOME